MPAAPMFSQQAGNTGVRRVRVELVDEALALGLQPQRPVGERGRDRLDRLLHDDAQSPFAELAHQRGGLLDQHEAAAVDHAHAVRHLLGFLDIMRGEDDGDAAIPQPTHELPHVATQADIHTGGRFVEEQDVWLMAQRLGDHHAALHAARQLDDGRAAFLPEREIAQQPIDMGGGRDACRTNRG